MNKIPLELKKRPENEVKAWWEGYKFAIKVFARPHGEWKTCEDTEFCRCSNCQTVVMLEESVRFRFCPNCGADMRKEGQRFVDGFCEGLQSMREGETE